jgi:hypothetical protein
MDGTVRTDTSETNNDKKIRTSEKAIHGTYTLSYLYIFATDVMCYVCVCYHDFIDVSIIYILNIRIYVAPFFHSAYHSLLYRTYLLSL